MKNIIIKEEQDERRPNQYKRLHMLEGALAIKTKGITKLKPFMEAVFYVNDESSLDEFWAFMLREDMRMRH